MDNCYRTLYQDCNCSLRQFKELWAATTLESIRLHSTVTFSYRNPKNRYTVPLPSWFRRWARRTACSACRSGGSAGTPERKEITVPIFEINQSLWITVNTCNDNLVLRLHSEELLLRNRNRKTWILRATPIRHRLKILLVRKFPLQGAFLLGTYLLCPAKFNRQSISHSTVLLPYLSEEVLVQGGLAARLRVLCRLRHRWERGYGNYWMWMRRKDVTITIHMCPFTWNASEAKSLLVSHHQLYSHFASADFVTASTVRIR